jgi:hypothetical protein
MASRPIVSTLLAASLWLHAGSAAAQTSPDECRSFALDGTVLDCTAAGSARAQLRTATFVAGSAAAGEMIAQAIALEVATAPLGSSSGGFTFTFDPTKRAWNRTSSTFGPLFSERALTLGRRKLSTGFNFISRTYDELDGLDLKGFSAFQFQGGSLPVSVSNLELDADADTLAVFAHYGLFDAVDIGVSVPYVWTSVAGTSRILASGGEELLRVRIDSSQSGLGDIAIFGKYRFWQSGSGPALGDERGGALAVAVTTRLPTGDSDELLGLDLSRTLLSFIGSAVIGRFSPHFDVGYEFWSSAVSTPRDFRESGTLSIRDQVSYNGGLEFELSPRLTVVGDLLGRYLRGGGRVGYQTFFFGSNRANVAGAEALVSVPGGYHTVVVAPGAKWNFYRTALLTGSVLISATDGGLRDRFTPVVGIDWGF